MKKTRSHAQEPDEATSARYRTAAVARMLQMPAATLRIWERRYGVAAPATTSSGHRQYSAADVQRLALIRQLTQVGHAIGSLAALDAEALREVAATHAAALTRAPGKAPPKGVPLELAVVGRGAEHRLTRPDVQLRTDVVVQVALAFDALTPVRRRASPRGHDALLVFVDGLQGPMLREVQAAAQAVKARQAVVVYSFANTSTIRAFTGQGIALFREPLDDAGLADALNTIAGKRTPSIATARARSVRSAAPTSEANAPLGRRYDDAALADFAGLSTTIACECPRHLAEIILKLSHFEAYSAQCEHLDANDAALHAYLARITATARSIFESALEHLAVQEGLVVRRR